MDRLKNIIDMLEMVNADDRVKSDIIDLATGKYKKPETFRQRWRVVKRNRKYDRRKN